MIENPAMHNYTKHIDIRYHFIRDIVSVKRLFGVAYINTKLQVADVLTKAMARPDFERIRGYLGLGY